MADSSLDSSYLSVMPFARAIAAVKVMMLLMNFIVFVCLFCLLIILICGLLLLKGLIRSRHEQIK